MDNAKEDEGEKLYDNNMELKCSPHKSDSGEPCGNESSESRSSQQQSANEAVLSDNKLSEPKHAQIDAVPNGDSVELKTDAQHCETESYPNDNGAEIATQQPQVGIVLNNDDLVSNSGSQQSQIEAVPNLDNVSPQKPEIETSATANVVNSNSSMKSCQTDAATRDVNGELNCSSEQLLICSPSSVPLDGDKKLLDPESQPPTSLKPKVSGSSDCNSNICESSHPGSAKLTTNVKNESSQVPENKSDHDMDDLPKENSECAIPYAGSSSIKSNLESRIELKNATDNLGNAAVTSNGNSGSKYSFLLDEDHEGSESGTEEEQSAFMMELENFFRERSMEFKPPKFYGEGLNCLKLWRAVMKLGGYDKVTSCKLWRQVGESFRPPKTCTTVSWTFRGFYEKALLDYERHKIHGGELDVPHASSSEPVNVDSQASGSFRARRDAATRAMQGWHSQRLIGNGEVSDPIIKDKNSTPLQKHEKQLKTIGLLKRKTPSYMEDAVKAARTRTSKPRLDVEVVDLGPPADWVKVNVQRTKDCFEVYALVPGLLREEVRVQSDPAGRLVISGEPDHPDNPWGVTPFKKVVSLPSRIDPHHTSAVVTLHGQLFVRVPFEQSD
ncbi:AT-rich interactive domain-containing protein 6-like isoform X1 [Euphorbia lathyris]|uniref:AT-rich interactive domain-containing protein 6-like isoform X1 n=1 Tax=Euphorbia lathyris TaxID=212925 RepID=UPI0033136416